MLLVLSIMVVLLGIGTSAFSGLRTTVLMNEQVNNLEQNIRWAQRSSILLKREPDDRWLYGIGITFYNTGTTRKYSLFKWCSEYIDYGSVETSSSFPNYNPEVALGPANGNMPNANNIYEESSGSCDKDQFLTGTAGSLVRLDRGVTELEAPLLLGFEQSINTRPTTIIFEAVTGNAFLYNSSGQLMNYTSAGALIANPIDFTIALIRPDLDRGTKITVNSQSGKLSSETVEKSEIITLIIDNIDADLTQHSVIDRTEQLSQNFSLLAVGAVTSVKTAKKLRKENNEN